MLFTSKTMPIIDDVRNILAMTLHLGARADTLRPDTTLLGSLPELDSMGVVNIITGIEDHFGIMVADDEISAGTFETFGTLVAFVEQKLVQ
jgi:acyl carrier protein